MAKNIKSIAHHWMQQGKEEAKAVKLVNIIIQKEKVNMATEMLKEGIPLESIIKITKFSKEDLER